MSAHPLAPRWSPTPPRPTMAAIAERVAEKHGVSVDDIKGMRRFPHLAHPRHEAMHEMYATGLWSFEQIARFFGGRDRTGVRGGIRAHAARLAAEQAGAA